MLLSSVLVLEVPTGKTRQVSAPGKNYSEKQLLWNNFTTYKYRESQCATFHLLAKTSIETKSCLIIPQEYED